jgi:hypothetical protein
MRIEEDIKEFLNLIWMIEKGEIYKKNNKKPPELINDTLFTPAKKGEIYKILTKQIEKKDNDEKEIIFAKNERSMETNQAAMSEIINEVIGENQNQEITPPISFPSFYDPEN